MKKKQLKKVSKVSDKNEIGWFFLAVSFVLSNLFFFLRTIEEKGKMILAYFTNLETSSVNALLLCILCFSIATIQFRKKSIKNEKFNASLAIDSFCIGYSIYLISVLYFDSFNLNNLTNIWLISFYIVFIVFEVYSLIWMGLKYSLEKIDKERMDFTEKSNLFLTSIAVTASIVGLLIR
ncbi:hypothetical protein ACFP65_10820 [Marinilactibacillus sp. GCM10026970]|uniref:hypothetical protein n=1 Tax=Marinilactibacillus sp. GCM10026970 TaxID=3252642 RepID=UPI003620DEE2